MSSGKRNAKLLGVHLFNIAGLAFIVETVGVGFAWGISQISNTPIESFTYLPCCLPPIVPLAYLVFLGKMK